MDKAFCILAAGKGTRVKSLGTLHKAILPLKNTTVLTQIIEKCPNDTQIVIAVGYQKDIIKEYCDACHNDRNIIFVDVDNYENAGSGPGYSLFCCKELLQRPFYLCCADCLIQEDLPSLDYNWLGVQPIDDPIHWSTAKIEQNKIVDFKNKDLNGFNHAWIGIAGIKDYNLFWSKLSLTNEKEYEVISAFYNPLDYDMKAELFTWFDTGTSENYKNSLESITRESLGMAKLIDEVTCQYKGQCVKLFGSIDICQGRINRAHILEDLTPKLTYTGKHVYAYNWIEGSTLYENESLEVFANFLTWCTKNLWKLVDSKNFQTSCYEFYYEKTQKRYNDYLKKSHSDEEIKINERLCEPVEAYLKQIDWDRITDGIPVKFHGDLQPENIIVDPQGYFHLIDWRDSFANLTYGDMYYDMAKLYGGLNLCYHSIKKNKFHIEIAEEVHYSFYEPSYLETWKHYYENWLTKNHFDLYKIRVLTALIYLNMSPLHISPFDELLFNHSKYLLSLCDL